MGAKQSPQSQARLESMGEEELLACLVEARQLGDADRMRQAMGRLAWGRYDQLVAHARFAMHGATAGEVEDIVQDAFVNVLKTDFRGVSVGEFVSLLKKIVARRAADRLRKKVPMPASTIEVDGDELSVLEAEASEEGPEDLIVLQGVVQQVRDTLSDEHGAVIDLFLWERLSGQAISERLTEQGIPMSVDNVHQIITRFRRKLKLELKAAEEFDGRG